MPNRVDLIRSTAELVQQGLQGSARASRPFADLPAEVQAAVNAYDEARRASYAASFNATAQPMSDANKATIAPMIMAAVAAYAEATTEERAA